MDGEEMLQLKEKQEKLLRELEQMYYHEFGTRVRFMVMEVIEK